MRYLSPLFFKILIFMAPRACNTRFLKKEFDLADMFEFKIFPS